MVGAGQEESAMPSDETRRMLKTFGVAVTNLEDAIEEKRPTPEIIDLDAVLADRTRELMSLLERLRSRRPA